LKTFDFYIYIRKKAPMFLLLIIGPFLKSKAFSSSNPTLSAALEQFVEGNLKPEAFSRTLSQCSVCPGRERAAEMHPVMVSNHRPPCPSHC